MLKYLRKVMETFGKAKSGKIQVEAKLSTLNTSVCGTCRINDKTSIQYCKCCGHKVYLVKNAIKPICKLRMVDQNNNRRREHIRRTRYRKKTGTLAGKRAFITCRMGDAELKTQGRILHSTKMSFQGGKQFTGSERNLVRLKKSNGQSNVREFYNKPLQSKKNKPLERNHLNTMWTNTPTAVGMTTKNKRIHNPLMTFVVEYASTPIKHQPKTSTPVKTI